METRRTRTRLVILGAVLALVVAACSSDDADDTTTTAAAATTTQAPATTAAPATTQGTTTTTTEAPLYGEPETDTIVIGGRLPNLSSNAVAMYGIDVGYFAEEGLTNVEKLVVDDPLAALVGGSLHVAALTPGALAQALAEGIELVVVAGKRCAVTYTIAIQPEFETAEDLAGEDALVALFNGDPAAKTRHALLAQNGWDLLAVDGINYVVVAGGSDAWVNLFEEGKLAVTPFFGRHKAGMIEYGATIAVDELVEWPNDVMVVTREFLDENPNAVGRWTRAWVKSNKDIFDDSTQDRVVEAVANQGGRVTDADVEFYVENKVTVCENAYLNEDIMNLRYESDGIDTADLPAWDAYVEMKLLLAAQEAVGLDNEPSGAPNAPQGG